jgi:benzoyl-CoA 2,3-dioxygenase component B
MSEPTELVEEAAAVRGDAFVEVNYDDRIPNNVDLSSDKQLQRALETWQPNYVDWWKEMGPEGFQEAEVYLRTARGGGPSGWAKFGHVKMPEYRWGILLGAQGRRPRHSLWSPQGPTRLAGSAG